MLKQIKKVWENTYFGVYPVFRFLKRIFYLVMFCGAIFSIVFYFAEQRVSKIEKGVEYAINNKWVQKADEAYLNVNFTVDEIPFILTREKVKDIVKQPIKARNYEVRVREIQKKGGFVVKPDIRFSDKVRVFYTDDIEVNGKTTTRLWLISDQYLKKQNVDWSKYEITPSP